MTLPRPAWIPRRERAALLAGLLLVACCTAGCTTYSTKMVNLRPELAAGDFESALATVEKETGKKDRMLYFLERGLILHYADRWRESNVAFAKGEDLADELYTKSLSEGALSLFSNDGAISYRARPFELAMVPYYKALNYIYLHDREAAQVEARRASLQLERYVDATLEGVREEDRGDLEIIRNNAFLLLVSGLLYDWDGALNDAFIAYRNSAHAFQQSHALLGTEIPPSLAADLERTGRRLGFAAELDQLRSAAPDVFTSRTDTVDAPRNRADYEEAATWQSGQGEVVLFLESGFVSQKMEVSFDFPVFEGEAYSDSDYWGWEIYGGMGDTQALIAGRTVEYWVSVAAPELEDSDGALGRARVRAVPADSVTAAAHGNVPAPPGRRVESLSRQARVTFDAEKPSIFFKTILRGLTKYLASRGAEKAGGGLAKWATNILGAATESADTRSWLTLPADVHLVRLALPAGTWDLEVLMTGPHGSDLGMQVIEGVEVRSGDWTFLSRRLF
ncbi:MAG: hypothetical protein GY838_01295 [bacterium]|nr:hypothetical protein [bacterium]